MRARLAALSALLALAVPPAALGWTWPVDGPVLRPFSFGSDPYAAGQHRGIDIGAPSGTPVRAAAGGVVSFAGTVPKGGKTVTIQTSSGYAVTLVHLGSIRVLRGTAIEEGATVGTVGPSGVPDIPEPYVYLGIRVASDEQGYVDPLRFLPPRAEPPAAPEPAADPPSAPAGESSGSEPAAPAAAEPPPVPVVEGSGEPSSETSQEPATTPEPASEPVPAADTAGAPAAAPDVEASSTEAASAQAPHGGRAVVPAEEPAAAPGGSARAGASPPVAAIATEPSVAPTVSVEPLEHHATPAGATQPSRAHVAVVTRSSPQGAVVQLPLVRDPQPRRVVADAAPSADASQRGGSHSRKATHSSSRDGAWIAAALVAALAAALAIRRLRRRPGATPAGAEAPRMMVLVGGSGQEADARRVDRQPGAAADRPSPIECDERLAA